MKRLFKWLLRIFGVVGVITSIALLLYINALPGIAESKIVAALKEMGIDPASARVWSVSTNHLQLTDLTIASEETNAPGLRVGSIGVDYDLSLTGSLTVKEIDIVGAVMQLNLRDGKLDMGPLAKLKPSEGESNADANLPFNALRVRSSSLILDWDGKRFALPVEMILKHEGKGVCAVQASVQLMGLQVPVTGTIDLTAPPVEASTKANRPADGVSFTLKAIALDHAVMLIGRAGGKDGSFDMAIKPVDSPQAFETATTKLAIRRDAKTGTKLVFHIEGQPQALGLDLQGQRVDLAGFRYALDAELDLDEPLLTVTLDADAQRMTLTSDAGSTMIEKPAFRTVVTGSFLDDHLLLSLADGDVLTFDRIESTQGDRRTTLAAAALNASDVAFAWPVNDAATPSMPLLRFNLSTSPLTAASRAGNAPATEAGLQTLILRGELSHPTDEAWPFTGSLTVTNASATLPVQKVEVAGVNIVLPITQAASPRVEPLIAIDKVAWDGMQYASPSGSLSMIDGVLRVESNWPLFENQPPMTLDGAIDLTQVSPHGTIAARMQNVHIVDDQAIARQLRMAQGWRITGGFDFTADLTIKDGTLTPDARLIIRDAAASNRRKDAAFTGINANVKIDNLAPLSTPPDQRLSAKAGHVGKLQVSNVVTIFRVESPQSVALDLAASNIGKKGRIWLHACRFNPDRPVLQTQVFVEDLSIGEWLEMLTDEKVKGEGFLYGRLPVRVDSARDPALTFGQGFLYAKPGGGWISIANGSEASQYVVKSIDDVFGAVQQEVRRYLIEAVHDYGYDRLQFDFYPQNNKLNCLVTTSGKGRTGAKAPIGKLEVNIDDFGSFLSNRILRSANAPGSVDDALERFFGK